MDHACFREGINQLRTTLKASYGRDIGQHQHFTTMAERMTIRFMMMPAEMGLIMNIVLPETQNYRRAKGPPMTRTGKG